MCLDRLAEFKITKNYGWQVFAKRGATGKIAIPTNFRYIRADVIVARERLVESKLSEGRKR